MGRDTPEKEDAVVLEAAEALVKWRASCTTPAGLNAQGLRVYRALMNLTFPRKETNDPQIHAWEAEAQASRGPTKNRRFRLFGLFS
jgi:hypothetical protein